MSLNFCKEQLNLENGLFFRIDHAEAIVAEVYRVQPADGKECILKICSNIGEYKREVYFRNHFANRLPLPRIVNLVPPKEDFKGAILMQYVEGRLLENAEITEKLAFEMGALLARIYLERVAGYGDLIDPQNLNLDPQIHFTLKFAEGLQECCGHLPPIMIEKFQAYYEKSKHLLSFVDGPCVIHRDFRAGNIIIHDGKIQGIIDWASGRAGFAEDDFCSIEHQELPFHVSSKKAFLSGYKSIRAVPDFKEMMPLLRFHRAIAIVGFTVKRQTWNNSCQKLYAFNRRFLETIDYKELR
jgi:Ser/Thr protein kinase RdoA (MazF antagonist)